VATRNVDAASQPGQPHRAERLAPAPGPPLASGHADNLELRAVQAADQLRIAAQPGYRATLAGDGWSVPVSIRAISASTSEAEDHVARRLLGPGYVLDDDAEEWAAVIVTYGGQTRIASSFLPPADVARLLRLGLEETARMIDQGDE
jgi:hypothetical protein